MIVWLRPWLVLLALRCFRRAVQELVSAVRPSSVALARCLGRRHGARPRGTLVMSEADRRRARQWALARGREVEVGVGWACALRWAIGIGLVGIGSIAASRHAAPLGLVLAAVALPAPRLAAGVRLRSWRRHAAADVPLLLDVLAAAMTVSVSPAAALGVAARAVPRRLVATAERAHLRARLGAPAMAALAAEADAVGVGSLAVAATSVLRDVQVGLPVAERLHAIAAQLRSEADTDRMERAGRIVPMATLISAMVIAPACVVILAVIVIGGGLAAAPGLPG